MWVHLRYPYRSSKSPIIIPLQKEPTWSAQLYGLLSVYIYIYYLSNIATEKKRKKKGPHSIKSSSSFRCSITPSEHAGMQISGLSPFFFLFYLFIYLFIYLFYFNAARVFIVLCLSHLVSDILKENTNEYLQGIS